MNTSINYPLPKQTFKNLASTHANNCISIYLSMYKTGKEQNEHLAQANLKHCIREVQAKLFEYQYSKEESKNYLKPVKQLLDSIELWRNPSDGLAIFLNPKELVYYTIPISFETKTYVADHFYLKPLLPLYSDDGLYYVLELSMDYVKLHQASKHAFKELFIELQSRDFNLDLELTKNIRKGISEIDNELFGFYIPAQEEIYLNMARICKRSKIDSVLEELSNGN